MIVEVGTDLNVEVDASGDAVLVARYPLGHIELPSSPCASAVVVDVPAAVGFTLPIIIVRNVDGSLYADTNPRVLHTQATSGATYYVDGTNGSNSNNGLTPATAFASPQYAALKNSSDATTIIIKGGLYTRSDVPSVIYSKNMTIMAAPGERVVFAICDVLTSWTNTTGTVWKKAITSANGVLDNSAPDADGNPVELKLVTSTALVASTPGSWFLTAGEIHVNLPDGRTPDSNVLVSRPVPSNDYGPGVTGNDVSTYFEGIEWWGGTTGNFNALGTNWQLYAKRCKWMYAGLSNGLTVRGFDVVALVDCEASHNYLDGFNYHENSAHNCGQVIEVNCSSVGNGKNPGSNNGSTSHEAYKVVRVGGSHVGNKGANVADVNSAASFNVGVRASDSTGYEQDFYGSELWLDTCDSRSPNSFVTDGVGTIHTRNCTSVGTPSGTVTPY